MASKVKHPKINGWGYRVKRTWFANPEPLRAEYGEYGSFLNITEVYFVGKARKVAGWTDGEIGPAGDTISELAWAARMIGRTVRETKAGRMDVVEDFSQIPEKERQKVKKLSKATPVVGG